MTMDETLIAALAQIPWLRDVAPESIEAQRLGGLTNIVHRVSHDGNSWVVRLPGVGTEAYIDRRVEAHNARVAAAAGVSAGVLLSDVSTGLMVTQFIDGCVTMDPARFKDRNGAPARAAAALRRLHRSGLSFEFRFELFAMIDNYLAKLSELGAALPEGYHEVVGEAEAVRRALDAHPAALAPCHCDPLCENFLDDGERMWIVDWEYSGMNDPIWDLGDLSVEAGFDAAQDREMMEAYCDGPVPGATFGRMVIYKAMCDLLWTLWGLIQHTNDNPADDFWAYSLNRFERCKTLMGAGGFARHLEAVRAG